MPNLRYFVCQVCHRPVEPVTLRQAGEMLGVCSGTIQRWMKQRKVHTIRTPGGGVRICRDSLVGWSERSGEKRTLLPLGPKIKRAAELIEEQYHDPGLTLERLSKQFRLSVGHLSRLFTKETGWSFRRYVMRVRMEKAAELLLGSSLCIKEIAAAVGYKHVADFDHHFRMVYGMTPSEYRQESARTEVEQRKDSR